MRPDGESSIDLPGIVLLDPESSKGLSEKDLAEQLRDVVALPIADLLDRTPSIVDMVPPLMSKPWYATLTLRDQLATRGFDLPTQW